MSRLIIKNIPSYITPARLKDHFSQKDGPGGTLTDVKVAQKTDGTSRRFAFVGFKSDAEAKKAQEWFDRTYIDTTRISVQVVEKGTKDAPAPRPNKKPRLDPVAVDDHGPSSTRLQSKNTKEPRSAHTTKSKKETQVEEFLQVMQPRTKKLRTWANEETLIGPSVSVPGDIAMTDALATSTQDVRPFNNDMEEGHVEEVDDLEWMKRRMARGIKSAEEKAFSQDDEVPLLNVDDSPKHQNITEEEKESSSSSAVDTILRTGRLFLRNLAFSCSESDLAEHFSSYGTISQAHIPLDHNSKSSKGIAFVTFADPSSAVRAYEELDKTSFQGRLLHILPAAERKAAGVQGIEEGIGKVTLKNEKEKKRKENASKEFNWSFLYMNADAVASSIADRMNIPKADILNPEPIDGDYGSAAVKLALAETHIISETKSYLELQGIDLSVFSSLDSGSNSAVRARRSDTCILVKNIPYGTTADQIREMFEPHGQLTRVLVPPAGTIAVVDFVHPDEAAKGFRAVAYRRLGSSVVYLEKAPLGIFSAKPEPTKELSSKKQDVPPVTIAEDATLDEESEAAPGSTLFVKNLSFATTSDRLTAVFRHLPSFAFARVQTKPDPKHSAAAPGQPAPRLSMGFGFVGFNDPEAAKKALRSMHGFVLDGHTLSVKFAGRGTEEDKAAEKGKEKVSATTTKMIVKNVPFEATKQELRALFGSHGQLRSVRLPRKFGSSTRGFAFLDFVSRREAENAYAALKHTHLLGRHLVLDWAEDTQDVDALRKKAGVGYGDGAELPGRKRKLELREDDGDLMGEE